MRKGSIPGRAEGQHEGRGSRGGGSGEAGRSEYLDHRGYGKEESLRRLEREKGPRE